MKLRALSRIYLDDDNQNNGNGLVINRPRRGRRIAFGWYGGKFNHLDWLLPLLPSCHHYCEPFAGSAAVLLNREPSPVETYNDIDGEVVNFFRVLRDRTDELIKAIALTPFSREEFYLAVTPSDEPPVAEVHKQAEQYFAQGHEVNFVLIKEWLLALLATTGKHGRSIFNQQFMALLEDPNTPEMLKVAWNEQIKKLLIAE